MPGPGEYNLTSDFNLKKSNGYSIGKTKRLVKVGSYEKIGPGSYPMVSTFTKDSVGGLPFQKADYYRSKNSVQPREKAKMFFPGPGQYSSS